MNAKRSRQQLKYRDNKFQGTDEEYERLISTSTTLYVGNMSFCTTEDQVLQLFSMAGHVKRIIMGIDRIKKTSCGFCFVEYYSRKDAENAYNYINRTNLDERIIRTDWDAGFSTGRQYGRGRHGGQMRDEYRSDFDPGRGGFSVNMGQHIGKHCGKVTKVQYLILIRDTQVVCQAV